MTGNNISCWFYKCQKLTSGDLSKINFSADAAMSSMFEGRSSLSDLDVRNWDTSRVTSVGYMFNGCSSLRSLTAGTGFTLDLSKTGFPVSTLFTADRTAAALDGVPKGVVATYYTKAEYVPQQPAGDESAADQGSAVQNADAAANAVVGDAPPTDRWQVTAPSLMAAPPPQHGFRSGHTVGHRSGRPHKSLIGHSARVFSRRIGWPRAPVAKEFRRSVGGAPWFAVERHSGSICTSHKKSPCDPFFSGCAGFAMARVTGSCGYFAEALSLSAP